MNSSTLERATQAVGRWAELRPDPSALLSRFQPRTSAARGPSADEQLG